MAIDYGRLISRSWEIVSRNRVLMLLGLIATLIEFFINLNGTYNSYTRPSLDGIFNPDRSSSDDIPPIGTLLLGNGVSYLWLLLAVAMSFISAASEAALVATADHIERTHEQPTFAEAWGLGWRKMIPVWLLNLLLICIILFIFIIAAVPILIGFGGAMVGITNESYSGGSILLGGACGCLLLLAAIPVVIVLLTVREYSLRALVLENQGVLQALGTGWQFMRANIRPTVMIVLIEIVAFIILGVITGILGLVFTPLSTAVYPVSLREFDSGLHVAVGVLAFVTATVTLLINAPFNAFTSALWTLFYRNRRQMPGSELAPAGMIPPGGGTPYGAAPPYNPAGNPPSYPPP